MTLTVADSATSLADDGPMGSDPGPRADRPRRRSFTAQYKLAMVAEYDRLPAGEKGALLRREGLYSSHIIERRRAPEAGTRAGPGGPVMPARWPARRPHRRPQRNGLRASSRPRSNSYAGRTSVSRRSWPATR